MFWIEILFLNFVVFSNLMLGDLKVYIMDKFSNNDLRIGLEIAKQERIDKKASSKYKLMYFNNLC